MHPGNTEPVSIPRTIDSGPAAEMGGTKESTSTSNEVTSNSSVPSFTWNSKGSETVEADNSTSWPQSNRSGNDEDVNSCNVKNEQDAEQAHSYTEHSLRDGESLVSCIRMTYFAHLSYVYRQRKSSAQCMQQVVCTMLLCLSRTISPRTEGLGLLYYTNMHLSREM